MKQHIAVKYTKHYKSHHNCCILLQSYAYIIQAPLIMASELTHVGHDQSSSLVIGRFGVILWSALLHLHSGI